MAQHDQVSNHVRWGAAVYVGLSAGALLGGSAGLLFSHFTNNTLGSSIVGLLIGATGATLAGRLVFQRLTSVSHDAVGRPPPAIVGIARAIGLLGSVFQIVAGVAALGTVPGKASIVGGILMFSLILFGRRATAGLSRPQ